MVLLKNFMNIRQRLIDITYQEKLSHLSSCLSALPIIEEIYTLKKEDDIFILSNGHSGLALYCVLEAKYGINPIELLHKHGIHPGKDVANKLYCSTGSLGSGLPIAFIHKYRLNNLQVYVNINGMGAYDYIDTDNLKNRLKSFLPNINIRESSIPDYGFAKGLLSHYYVLKPEDYDKI